MEIDTKKIREEFNLSQQQLADLTGIPKGRINGWEQRGTTPKLDDYKKLVQFVNENKGIQNLHQAPAGRLPKRTVPHEEIPFYDVDFAAGDIDFYNGQSTIQAAYTMDIPEFNGCTAFRTYGDSMEKLIRSGDILFATRIEDWQSHLEYGQIYGIICTDKRRYLKYIRKSKKSETHFLLRSENENYDDFSIPKDKIKNIWLIHGWMNKRV